jgi:hypothetical protein
MEKLEFSPGDTVYEVDKKITEAYRLISGKLGLEWKWSKSSRRICN